jgi:tetrahydromethanopterin S-methyltransferase subunit A
MSGLSKNYLNVVVMGESARQEEMKKLKLTYDWPVEQGRYLVSNPLSPVAVVVILAAPYDKIPKETEELVRFGLEKGAGISGTLQTANIGIEKIVINLISNPNIRYLILAGRESGHFPADALKALFENGADEKCHIIKTKAPTAILKNIPEDAIKRLREQVQLVDLSGITETNLLEEAVRSCYQEEETSFESKGEKYRLYDPGYFSKEPIIFKLTDKLKTTR